MPTIFTGAHHGVGEEFLWLRHWHTLPQGAGGDDYHKHRTNTQLLTSPAGHATAAPGSYRRPGCASQHLPALSVKHKPGHAGHQPPAQPTGFHPCRGHQGLARTLVTTEAPLQHRGWCNCLSVCCAAPAWCEPGHSGCRARGHVWVAVPNTDLGTSACCPARWLGLALGSYKQGQPRPGLAGWGASPGQAAAPVRHSAAGLGCPAAWREALMTFPEVPG